MAVQVRGEGGHRAELAVRLERGAASSGPSRSAVHDLLPVQPVLLLDVPALDDDAGLVPRPPRGGCSPSAGRPGRRAAPPGASGSWRSSALALSRTWNAGAGVVRPRLSLSEHPVEDAAVRAGLDLPVQGEPRSLGSSSVVRMSPLFAVRTMHPSMTFHPAPGGPSRTGCASPRANGRRRGRRQPPDSSVSERVFGSDARAPGAASMRADRRRLARVRYMVMGFADPPGRDAPR